VAAIQAGSAPVHGEASVAIGVAVFDKLGSRTGEVKRFLHQK
jgi:hypothetical protein